MFANNYQDEINARRKPKGSAGIIETTLTGNQAPATTSPGGVATGATAAPAVTPTPAVAPTLATNLTAPVKPAPNTATTQIEKPAAGYFAEGTSTLPQPGATPPANFSGTIRGGPQGAEYDDLYQNGVLVSRTPIGPGNPIPIDQDGNQYKPGMPGTPGTPAVSTTAPVTAPSSVSAAPPGYIQSLLDSIASLTTKTPEKVVPVVAPQVSAPSVSGEMGALLSKGGDYVRRATQFGINNANRRGLLNSSLAGGAGYAAALDAAAPLAQAQAQLGLSAAQSNQASTLQSLTQAQDINAQNARDQNLFAQQTALTGLNTAASMTLQQQEINARQEQAKLDQQLQMGLIDRQQWAQTRGNIEQAVALAQIEAGMAQFNSDIRVNEQQRITANSVLSALQGDAVTNQLGLPTDYIRDLTAIMQTPGLSGEQLTAAQNQLRQFYDARAEYARLIAAGNTNAQLNLPPLSAAA